MTDEVVKLDVQRALLDIFAAAKIYDDSMTLLEKEHHRPDMYFTQHSALLPLRKAARKLNSLYKMDIFINVLKENNKI